jgi:hypothetical protein
LPIHFKLSTFKLLTTSHPATWQINPNGVLTLSFKNIRLVDSFTNEKKSHGFFTYQLQLKDSIATGTRISNRAAIYFDFNMPIITKAVEHIIGKDYLKICAAKPTLSITATGCPSKNIVFNAISKNSGVNPLFAWYKNNEPSPLSTKAILTLNNLTNGTKIYCKMNVSSELCTETPILTSDTLKITCIVSNTEDKPIVESFEVYPNPSKGVFDLKLSLVKTAQIALNISNSLGQVMKTDKFETNDMLKNYDLSQFPKGVYMILLIIDGQRIVKKLIIQ